MLWVIEDDIFHADVGLAGQQQGHERIDGDHGTIPLQVIVKSFIVEHVTVFRHHQNRVRTIIGRQLTVAGLVCCIGWGLGQPTETTVPGSPAFSRCSRPRCALDRGHETTVAQVLFAVVR
jgi:hypothetical protein